MSMGVECERSVRLIKNEARRFTLAGFPYPISFSDVTEKTPCSCFHGGLS
ncbi:hypothetical protein ABID59_001931 [Bradyrhizobium sp. S3.3.6]